jgi:hypothetical protein
MAGLRSLHWHRRSPSIRTKTITNLIFLTTDWEKLAQRRYYLAIGHACGQLLPGAQAIQASREGDLSEHRIDLSRPVDLEKEPPTTSGTKAPEKPQISSDCAPIKTCCNLSNSFLCHQPAAVPRFPALALQLDGQTGKSQQPPFSPDGRWSRRE